MNNPSDMAIAKAFLEQWGQPVEINSRSVMARAREIDAAHAAERAMPGVVVAPRVVAWKFTPPCRESYWRDGAPDKYDRERAINIGCTIELAYSAPANAKADALDAARYRWIRSNDGKNAVCPHIQAMWANCKTDYPSREEWDAAIDAALAHPVAAQEGGS